MKLFEKTNIPLMSDALNAYAVRHKVIASNIANIGTPGYRAKAVEFEGVLSDAMAASEAPAPPVKTDVRHLSLNGGPDGSAGPRIVEAADDRFSAEDNKSGINDVDIDVEMAEMAKNQIRFKYVSRLIGESFRGIQKSIRGQA